MTLDLTNDHLIFDGLITVTLTDNVGNQTVPNTYKLEKEDVENSPSEGVYQSSTVEFQFPSTIARPPVIGGSVTTADAKEYTILETREPFLNDFYGAIAKEKVLSDDMGLRDVVSLWRHTTSTDSYGSQIVSHPVASVSGIQAKIQLMDSGIEDRVGKREFNRQYQIFVNLDIGDNWLSARDQIKDEGLIIYTVKSWKNRQSIRELSVILCERTTT